MKSKLALVLGVLLVFGILLIGCATADATLTQVQQKPAPQNEGFVNDRRFDGRWQSPDQRWELEFYADTYILFQYNNNRTQNRVDGSGVFNYTGNEIDCQLSPGMHFVLGYSLTGFQLIITSVGGVPDSLLGQWEKIDTIASGEENPLVGTWKCKTDSGFTFYQFYPDGTGRSYDCNESFTNMDFAGDITYNLNTSTINGLLVGVGVSVPLINAPFKIDGDILTQGELVLQRQ